MTTDLRLWERNSRSKVVQRTRKIIHVNEITYLGKWGKIMHVRILARSRYAIIIQWRTISSAKRERKRERDGFFRWRKVLPEFNFKRVRHLTFDNFVKQRHSDVEHAVSCSLIIINCHTTDRICRYLPESVISAASQCLGIPCSLPTTTTSR